jgi:hypothetical protein
MLNHWQTPTINDRITALHAAGVSYRQMPERIWSEFRVRITKGMALRRARTLGITSSETTTPRRPAIETTEPGDIPAWRTPEADALLRVHWHDGRSQASIARLFGVSEDAIDRRRKALDLQPRPKPELPPKPEKPLPVIVLAPPPVIAPLPPAVVAREPDPGPCDEVDPSREATVESTSVMALPKARECVFPMWATNERPTHVYCCERVSDGIYCEAHAGVCFTPNPIRRHR